MKIFYAVQATGNGHISRAAEILPYLQKYGEVDIFLSGNNAQLNACIQPKYISKGVSLKYNNKGGLDLCKIISNIHPQKIWQEARKLPVEDYDIVLNDFECITSLACRIKKIPSLQFGHQAAFQSPNSPRPQKKDPVGEFILRHYAKSSANLGLHFWPYDKNIVSPVLRNCILQTKPEFKDFIAVYLPQYRTSDIVKKLAAFPMFPFIVHSKDVTKRETTNNITLLPIDYNLFADSLIQCRGLITGAGFETPAEALYLGKNLMVIPIQGQYEQLCNAEALKEWHVSVVNKLDDLNYTLINSWINEINDKEFQLLYNTEEIVKMAIETALNLNK